MTPRSIRRAAERRALKQARKAEPAVNTSVTAAPAGPQPISERRLAANRANAHLSIGPNNIEGKAKVLLNAEDEAANLSAPQIQAIRGLTGRTVLLPTEDVAEYEALVAELQTKWEPVTPEEQRLTQALADTEWRLMRIPGLETGILSLGYRELAREFADIEDADVRRSVVNAKVFLTNIRQLTNLATQESRLRRQREKDTATLEKLQAARRMENSQKLDEAACLYLEAVAQGTNCDWEPEAFGFEFSKAEIEMRAIAIKPDLFDAFYEKYPKELAA